MMPYYKYYNPYNRNPYFYNNYRPAYRSNFTSGPTVNQHQNSSNSAPSPESRNNSNSKDDDDVWFDLFGIKLYFDDVLILSLLFFLYKEEVKDEGLFLALVLLLIS